jgi:hypothetical protein
MPPSPKADHGVERLPSLRRASSLPPENIHLSSRPSTPVSVIKQLRRLRIPDPDDVMDSQDRREEDGAAVEIEELSPEAIIPDSLPIMRDPEIETPQDDDEDDTEREEGEMDVTVSTNAAERMSDATVSDDAIDEENDEGAEAMDENESYAPPETTPTPFRKRKYSGGGGDGQGQRKRHFKPWMSSPG